MIVKNLLYFLILPSVLSAVLKKFEWSNNNSLVWEAGVQCLDIITKFYFNSHDSFTRVKNIGLVHSHNMSNPSYEIKRLYFKHLNSKVIDFKNVRQTYSLRLITDKYSSKINETRFDSLIMTDFYIIIVDNIYSLINLLENYVSIRSDWNPGAKFLLFYNNIEDRNNSQQLSFNIFGLLVRKYFVMNVGLIYAVNDTGYEFLILDYFNPLYCRKVLVKKVSSCENGKVESQLQLTLNVFIEKSIDLQNCTFFLCAKEFEPFVENFCKNGLELNLLRIIKMKLGFKLHITCSREERGVLLNNGTWTGLLGKLSARSCDFILGGFYPDNEIRETFSVTDSYLSDTYTWFINKADKRPPWKGLITVFKFETWKYVFLIFIITCLSWLIIGILQSKLGFLRENKSHIDVYLVALNTLGLLMNVSITNKPNYAPLRIFFVAVCIYSLNINGIYTSDLIAVFTNPGYEHQISTIEEVVNNNIPFGGRKESKDWFDNVEDKIIFQLYNLSHKFELNVKNFKQVADGKQVMLANRMYVLQNALNNKVYGFPKTVFSSPLEIITKRGFPLVFQFNDIIRRIQDAGFFSKLNNDFLFNNTILKYIKEPTISQRAKTVLTINHLQGAFVVLLSGLIISGIVFLKELFVKDNSDATNNKLIVNIRKPEFIFYQ